MNEQFEQNILKIVNSIQAVNRCRIANLVVQFDLRTKINDIDFSLLRVHPNYTYSSHQCQSPDGKYNFTNDKYIHSLFTLHIAHCTPNM